MKIARHIRSLEGYVPGEQPRSRRVIKLNTNENPYPPSPKCSKVLASFDLDRLRRYPDPNCSALAEAIAKANGTTADRVFVGNGSDEILSLCARAFVENDESIGSLDPSYSLYKTLAAIRDVRWVGLPSGRAAGTDIDIRRTPLDEAYADFACANCMSLATAPRNRNVIVMRTFSKSYSLAGLRVGYCIGPRDLIEALYKIKDSYNVDAVAQSVALAAFNDRVYHGKTVAKVVKTRRAFSAALEKLGWDVIPSEANFVFAKPPAPQKAKDIFARLKEKSIFVRYFPGPLTGDRLRITIGTDAEMAVFLTALKGI